MIDRLRTNAEDSDVVFVRPLLERTRIMLGSANDVTSDEVHGK